MRRALRPCDQSAHLRRGFDPVRSDRGARGCPARGGLPAPSSTVGGGLPRRQVLRPVPAKTRGPQISVAGLLRRRPRRDSRPGPAHPRCHALPHLLPRSRDRRSVERPRRLPTSFPNRALQVRVLPGAPTHGARRQRLHRARSARVGPRRESGPRSIVRTAQPPQAAGWRERCGPYADRRIPRRDRLCEGRLSLARSM